MYYFDLDKFWLKLKHLNLGTGTLATRAGIPPDAVQKLIALSEAEDDIGEKVIELLTEDVLAYVDEPEETKEGELSKIDPPADVPLVVSEYTVNELKQRIEAGTWTFEEVLDKERQEESPRSTLVKWLEEEIAQREYTEEEE